MDFFHFSARLLSCHLLYFYFAINTMIGQELQEQQFTDWLRGSFNLLAEDDNQTAERPYSPSPPSSSLSSLATSI